MCCSAPGSKIKAPRDCAAHNLLHSDAAVFEYDEPEYAGPPSKCPFSAPSDGDSRSALVPVRGDSVQGASVRSMATASNSVRGIRPTDRLDHYWGLPQCR